MKDETIYQWFRDFQSRVMKLEASEIAMKAAGVDDIAARLSALEAGFASASQRSEADKARTETELASIRGKINSLVDHLSDAHRRHKELVDRIGRIPPDVK